MPLSPAQLTAQAKSLKAKIAKLEKALAKEKKINAKQTKELKELLKCCADVQKWIVGKPGVYIGEAKWSKEVTAMLHQVDWAAIVAAFPGGGGGNPPQDPPDWPVT